MSRRWAIILVAGLQAASLALPVMAATPRAAARRPAPPSPSFDCRTARGAAQRIICGDYELAAKDRRLDALYRRARVSDAGREARENQLAWLAERDDCANVQCVRDALDARILQLEQAGL